MNNENLIKEMNVYLANLNLLYVKLHNYHWYINGKGFFQLHATYETLYDHITETLDEVAERILIIGEKPAASMKEYMALATLKERESAPIAVEASVKEVKEDFEIMYQDTLKLIALAEEAQDPITADMFTGYASEFHKNLWMMRAYLA